MSESNRQDESQQSTKEEDSKKKTKKDNIEDLIELIIKDEKTAEDNEKIKQDVKELLKESEQLTATAANNGQKWAFFLMVSYQLKKSDRKELIELGISLVEDARNIENEGNSFKEIKQIVTPSGLENLSKTWQMNLLELSLMVRYWLKKSSEESPDGKELEILGNGVEEYAKELLTYLPRIKNESGFIFACTDRITYAAIRYQCKKFLSGPTTQNYLKKLWTNDYKNESETSAKWILANLFVLFEVIFFPLIFVVYVYGIIKDLTENRRKEDDSEDGSKQDESKDASKQDESKDASKQDESKDASKQDENKDGVLESYSKHFHIPYFVFLRDTLSYVALLMLHIAVCVQPSGLRLSVLEWFIMVFFIGRFMQEVDQSTSERDEIHDLKTRYSNDFWNKLDVVTIIWYIVTFIFRMVTWSLTSQLIGNEWLVVTSYLYGINAGLLSLRVFGQIMEVKQATGTKQIALMRIINAVFVILVQMVAAITGFSLILTKIYVSEISYVGNKTSHGVCLSSEGLLCWWHFFEFLAWSTMGSSDQDLLTLTTGVSNYISKTIYMLFLIVAAVMIMNMLIALLSNIYQLVEENARAEWCYRKACLIKTYCNYHTVPVPFNIITLFIKLICVILSKLGRIQACFGKPFTLWQEIRKAKQNETKNKLMKIGEQLNKEYLAEYGDFFPHQESVEEKILKRNQRLLRHIVREVYLEETQLSRTSKNWVVLDEDRPLSVENQRMYMVKKCTKDAHIGDNNENSCIHSVRHNQKLSKDTPGFEVLIESAGSKRYLGIGLTSRENKKETFPGNNDNSVGYIVGYGEQPGVSHRIDEIDPFPYTGDMIGCRVMFDEPATDDGYLVQLTRNRRLVGQARAKRDNLFPFVAITHPDVKVLFRFVKDDQSTYKEKDDSSNQKENKGLSQEVKEMKKVCQHLQSQNQEIKQMLQHVYRSMLPSDRKEWEIFV